MYAGPTPSYTNADVIEMVRKKGKVTILDTHLAGSATKLIEELETAFMAAKKPKERMSYCLLINDVTSRSIFTFMVSTGLGLNCPHWYRAWFNKHTGEELIVDTKEVTVPMRSIKVERRPLVGEPYNFTEVRIDRADFVLCGITAQLDAYYAARNNREALAYCNDKLKSLRLRPQAKVDLLLERAYIHRALKDNELAYVDASEALALAPENAQAFAVQLRAFSCLFPNDKRSYFALSADLEAVIAEANASQKEEWSFEYGHLDVRDHTPHYIDKIIGFFDGRPIPSNLKSVQWALKAANWPVDTIGPAWMAGGFISSARLDDGTPVAPTGVTVTMKSGRIFRLKLLSEPKVGRDGAHGQFDPTDRIVRHFVIEFVKQAPSGSSADADMPGTSTSTRPAVGLVDADEVAKLASAVAAFDVKKATKATKAGKKGGKGRRGKKHKK